MAEQSAPPQSVMEKLAAAVRRRVRRWFGPTRAELRAEVDLWRGRCDWAQTELRAAYVRAKDAEKLVRRIRHEVYAQLNEPGRVDGCNKVRFHRQPEAVKWGIAIAESTGQDPEVFEAYECRTCPRSPVTMRRYWHACHDDTRAARAEKDAAARRLNDRRRRAAGDGKLIGQRLDPAVLARLRKVGRGGR